LGNEYKVLSRGAKHGRLAAPGRPSASPGVTVFHVQQAQKNAAQKLAAVKALHVKR